MLFIPSILLKTIFRMSVEDRWKRKRNPQALFSVKLWRKRWSRCYFLNLTEATQGILKYLLVNKVLLTGEQHFFVCYLVIRRGFMGFTKLFLGFAWETWSWQIHCVLQNSESCFFETDKSCFSLNFLHFPHLL